MKSAGVVTYPLAALAGVLRSRVALGGLVLAVLAIGVALASVWESHRIVVLTGELDRLQRAHDELLERRGQLLLERSAWTSFSRVEAVAGADLGMRVPAPRDIEVVTRD